MREPRPLVRLIQPLADFVQTEAAGGLALVAASLVAVAWANSPWSELYHHLLEMRFGVEFGSFTLDGSLHYWINDAAMVMFFFIVGLEIKRELTIGELNSVRRAIVPAVAAAGGMAVPALVFLAIVTGSEARTGWAVPMATDIAFALGVASLLGPRVPLGLKAFLLALAIFDDIGASIVIALFYGGALQVVPLLGATALVVGMAGLARVGVRSIPLYAGLGIAAWWATAESGVHPALVGVAVGLVTPWESWAPAGRFAEQAEATLTELRPLLGVPAGRRARAGLLLQLRADLERAIPPLDRLEHGLHSWVSFLIVPLFALANAGVDLRGGALSEAMTSTLAWGVAAGLVLGKPLGIVAGAWIAVRLGAQLPGDVSWRGITSMGVLAGIGFTVAIFVANLAFNSDEALTAAKIGIFGGSLVAGGVGYLLLRASRTPESP